MRLSLFAHYLHDRVARRAHKCDRSAIAEMARAFRVEKPGVRHAPACCVQRDELTTSSITAASPS